MSSGPPVLELRGVGKRYRRDQARTSLRSTLARRAGRAPWTQALHDVDLVVGAGQALGVVGRNGSGKSTLLRLCAGLTTPSSGTVVRHAAVSGLLSLGASTSGELSAADNAVTAAVLSGLSPAEARRRLPAIAEFAELGDVLEAPLRTFSDGMKVRLAFAAAVLTDPQLLLVDEVLAVGDLVFQEKCLSHLETLRDQGCAVLVASHVLDHLRRLCDEVIWLRDGTLHRRGPAAEVLDAYSRSFDDTGGPTVELAGGGYRKGSGEVLLLDVRCEDTAGTAVRAIPLGGGVRVVLRFAPAAGRAARAPVGYAGVSLRNVAGARAQVDLTSAGDGAGPIRFDGPGEVVLELDRLDLAPGSYWVDAGLYAHDWSRPFDYRWDAVKLVVTGPLAAGAMQPPHRWTARVGDADGFS